MIRPRRRQQLCSSSHRATTGPGSKGNSKGPDLGSSKGSGKRPGKRAGKATGKAKGKAQDFDEVVEHPGPGQRFRHPHWNWGKGNTPGYKLHVSDVGYDCEFSAENSQAVVEFAFDKAQVPRPDYKPNVIAGWTDKRGSSQLILSYYDPKEAVQAQKGLDGLKIRNRGQTFWLDVAFCGPEGLRMK